jgi:hypothetical protein
VYYYSLYKTLKTMKKFTFLCLIIIAGIMVSNNALGQITLRGSGTGTQATTGGILTITKPSGLAVGDLMIANIVQGDNDGADGGDLSNVTIPAGWTLIAGNQTGIEGGGNGDELWGTLLYKFATASDVAATGFSFTLDPQAEGGSGGIVAFIGVDQTTPFDHVPSTVYQNVVNDNSLSANAITTATANAAVIMFGVVGNDNASLSGWSIADPDDADALTELYDLQFNDDQDMGSGAAWALNATPGTTGAGTATLANAQWNGSLLVALKPAPPPPPSVSLTDPGLSVTTIVAGGNINFTATRSANGTWPGGNGTFAYDFSSSPTTGVTLPDPANTTNTSASTTGTFSTPGTYTISVTVTEQGGGSSASTTVNKTVKVLAATPTDASLWATSSSGTQVSSFVVSEGTYFSGPTNIFAPLFPAGVLSTAALGTMRDGSNNRFFYYLPNTGTNGVVTIWGANANGSVINQVGTIDVNGASTNTLGFVRLGMDDQGQGWILAGDGSTVYLAKFIANGTAAATVSIEDNNGITIVDGTASTFQNGDLAVTGNGTIWALANDGSGVTQVFSGVPNGNSTSFTRKFTLNDNNGVPFTGSVNGIAFDIFGSMYISTSTGLYYINPATVNGPAGTVNCDLVQTVSGLQDLASDAFPEQSVLPVTMKSFGVSRSGNNALLNWITSAEQNTDHFEIERSFDGVNFVKAGNVQAAGNSSREINYSFSDPITVTSGIIYYRLRTVDIDGKWNLSKIVSLRLSGKSITNFTVYPNPFTNNIKINVSSEKDMMVTIRISNTVGQMVVNRREMVQKGESVIVLSNELNSLSKGIHFMELITEEGTTTQKIVKQ